MADAHDASFLGRGWAFPVAGDRQGTEVQTVSGDEDVRQAILIILRTERGERLMRPEFGAGLRALIYEVSGIATHRLVQRRVEESLVTWEPRIDGVDVRVASDAGEPNVLRIHIEYRVRTTNTFYNLVYPFYLAEQKT